MECGLKLAEKLDQNLVEFLLILDSKVRNSRKFRNSYCQSRKKVFVGLYCHQAIPRDRDKIPSHGHCLPALSSVSQGIHFFSFFLVKVG